MRTHTEQRPEPRGLVATHAKKALIGLAIGLVIVAAGEFFFVRAEGQKVTNRNTQLAALKTENAGLEQLIGTPEAWDAFRRQCDDEQQQFDQALASVPSEAELAAALEDLRAVMSSTGVGLVSYVPGPLAPQPGPKPAGAAARPGDPKKDAPPAPPVLIQARPITVTCRAKFRTFQALLAALAGNQRLLTTEGFTMTVLPESGLYYLRAQMAIRCYYKQVPPAATSSAPATGQK